MVDEVVEEGNDLLLLLFLKLKEGEGEDIIHTILKKKNR